MNLELGKAIIHRLIHKMSQISLSINNGVYMSFNGLMCNLSTISLLSDAKTRSICSENRTGEKSGGAREMPPVDKDGNPTGPARTLGQGWKL